MAKQSVDWIQVEFYGNYPFGHYTIRYQPDGGMEYACEGMDLPILLPNGHRWIASRLVYQNLAKVLVSRPWEQEVDPSIKTEMVCDGWTDTLCWSIEGKNEEHSFRIGLGRASLLKIMERLKRFAKDEEKNLPHPIVHIPHP
ncbi:hypothetical protein [Paenibacillus harenae]|uniref:Uncharacterized protein n=1 Tax=Paenibacillus harenae TaxID=306543 RepID=A0ABT9U2P4_PAEHA|nr:hypothetical protein [Paenibacillus harenae]MDQ0112569.1 hypothetical protein [Paenibacillus harenae]